VAAVVAGHQGYDAAQPAYRRGYVAGWAWGAVCGAVCGALTTGLLVLLAHAVIDALRHA